MQLNDLKIQTLNIPFKVSFEHSSVSRSSTEAILVTATTKNNKQGLGEGCPRFYVTGETVESAQVFFNIYHDAFLKLSTVTKLKNWITKHRTDIDKNPAAFCAVELALLNAMAKENNSTVEGLLSIPELNGCFFYTAVLGSRKLGLFQGLLQQYINQGFKDYKIKLFGEKTVDQKNIETLKNLAPDDIRVRFDANNVWSNSCDAIDYIQSLNYPLFAIEEPLQARQYSESNILANSLSSKVILDESFTCENDFNLIETTRQSWVINLRISKMGGIIRSLAIAAKASGLGIPIIIGAQVGETSILTRAALTVANCYRNQVIAQEGAFGTHLLQSDIIEQPIMFGSGGCLDSKNIMKF